MNEILTLLKESNFSSSYWDDLGLKLGILAPDLITIKHDKHDADPCLKSVLMMWLEQNGDKCSYKGLVDALNEMGQNAVADCSKYYNSIFFEYHYNLIFTVLDLIYTENASKRQKIET